MGRDASPVKKLVERLMPVHVSPFPCAVYISDPRRNEFVYSHQCTNSVSKRLPQTLRVRDLQDHRLGVIQETGGATPMLKACFMVLVSGDVAQTISVENARTTRSRFLYHGSRFSVPIHPRPGLADLSSEVSSAYIALHFYSTLAMFSVPRISGVMDIECAMVLLPTVVRENQIHLFADWINGAILKAVSSSAWLTDREGKCYRERTLTPCPPKSSPIGPRPSLLLPDL